MKIIFGQGNPDKKYERTRHNTGFMILDALGERYGAVWRDIDTYKGRISTVMIGDEKVILVKPLSYYNDTGLVARQLIDYYKLTPKQDFLVVHDELALPLGTVRIRESGSDGGNNGVKSLNTHLGAHYTRIRVGIASEDRERIDDVNFVLGRFTKTEHTLLTKDIIPHTLDAIVQFVEGSLQPISASVNNIHIS